MREAHRQRVTTSKRRPLWDRWRLWVKIKRDGRVIVDAVPAAPLLIGRVELIGNAWRSRAPNSGWFELAPGMQGGYKNKLDAVERLLQHMVEMARG